MMLRRFLAIVGLLVMAACGGSNSSAPDGPAPADDTVFAPNFQDRDPVDFNGRTPARYPVHGIDAARFQSDIDWRTARRNGVNFAFIKATEGGDFLDPMFKTHWQGARRARVQRGAYHFYYFCTTPEVQAHWFIRNVPRGNMLPPVLDMEWNPFSPTCARVRPPASEVRRNMRKWLAIVGSHYQQRPIIYTTPKFYRENELDKLKGYEFWLRSTAKRPSEVYPGQPWVFWQYSATGAIGGIKGDVDLNLFQGSRAQWAEWVATRAK